MCDTFVVDEQGHFVVGKAQTTPEDESQGFLRSCRDALGYWGMALEEALPSMVSGVYSGTAMLNRLLERKGLRLGLLVSAGMEDALALERGVQTYLGYSYSDRLHVATHIHNPPLVPRALVRGVRERIDLFGDTVIPLQEEPLRRDVAELLDAGVEGLCVCLLHGYRNPAHELMVADVIEEVMRERGVEVPVFLASELYPLRGDFPRLNTVLVEAYAAEPSRRQIRRIRERTRELGAPFDLRVMASHGGTIASDARELARTLVSGPIGGVVGARHLGRLLDLPNLVCTDIGGTSFDLALVTEAQLPIRPNPEIARMVLSLPLVQVDSIGAGTGSYLRINPSNQRIEIGPDSAGARIGVCNPRGGVDVATVTDCHVVLGRIDPHYFLGGELELDPDRAHRAIEDQIAKPLGLDVHRAASGVLEILEDNLRNQLHATVLGKGYSPVSYALLCYGGGGPLHVGGYTRGMDFQDVLIPSWAAGFSAYGCSCADFEYRNDISIDLPVEPGTSDEELGGIADLVNGQIAFLKGKVSESFAASGVVEETIGFTVSLRMQYLGQLNDLEVRCRKEELEGPGDLRVLFADFEELYAKVYALAARSPELGYLLTTVVVAGSAQVEKPVLPGRPLAGKQPPAEAGKGERRVYWGGQWASAPVFEMDRLLPGNEIAGLAIVEAPATTLVVPPDREILLDEHLIFHLRGR